MLLTGAENWIAPTTNSTFWKGWYSKTQSSSLNTNCPALLLRSISYQKYKLAKVRPSFSTSFLRITWYSLYRWLQKLNDRINQPWGFKFKGEEEYPKAFPYTSAPPLFFLNLFVWGVGQGGNVHFARFIPFIQKTNSCFSCHYVQPDNCTLCWLSRYN